MSDALIAALNQTADSSARVHGEVLTPICSASLEMFSLLPGGMAEEKMAFSSSS